MDRLANSLRKGRSKAVLSGVNEALENGFDPQEIVSGGLVKGMMLLGEDFSAGRAFIPEMLVAAKCMTSALDVLKPLLQEGAMQKIGKVCLGTVKGDMHDIGKNLVRIMLEGGGFEVVDLGVDVPAEKFVEAAIEQRCDIIACSALLTTTMNEMRRVVQLAVEQGIRDKVFILIGGAPVTQSFCDEIGADAYTDDAAQSVLVATKLMESKKHSTSCN
ncbi:MAG: corrinoid protein [Oscillospiraceae bacterium]|nr:corrinoid protein [Oscillospiraceae bacterium]